MGLGMCLPRTIRLQTVACFCVDGEQAAMVNTRSPFCGPVVVARTGPPGGARTPVFLFQDAGEILAQEAASFATPGLDELERLPFFARSIHIHTCGLL